jgi:hypothetical protein
MSWFGDGGRDIAILGRVSARGGDEPRWTPPPADEDEEDRIMSEDDRWD